MKRARINNQITALEVRVIDDEGKNLGVLKVADAIEAAKQKGLDLIEISPSAVPPIAKIMDYGKFLYKEKRKERSAAKNTREVETKILRIHLGTSDHDLMLKAKQASEFLKEGHRLRIEIFLKGREKGLPFDFVRTKLKRVLNFITESHKLADDAKKSPRGMYMVVEKQ